MNETAMKAFAEALNRCADAYDRRTDVDARRLAFEERRELRIAQNAERRTKAKGKRTSEQDSA